MPKKQRDYRAEYRRRVERGRAKGWSKAIIRGHTPKTEIGPRLGNKLGIPPGTEIADLRINTVPVPGDEPKAIKASLRDHGLTPAEIRSIDVEDQEAFVKALITQHGFTFREAFDLYFGY